MTGQGQEGTAQDDDAGPSSTTDGPGAPSADSPPTPRARVVLVGPPGSGKSTIGRKLARELGVALYDTDAGIEAETGRTIPEIFATDGEPEFRRIEERVVRRAVLEHDGVVSLGGGSVLSERTREVLRGATVVYLEISVGEGLRRTGSSNARPLLNGTDPGAKYRELMKSRRPLYREVATVRVRTDGRSPGRVVRMILTRLGLESVRTDLAHRPGTPTPPAATATSRPGIGSNRSKARRRARARAAAARRAAAEEVGTADRGTSHEGDRTRSAAPRSGAGTEASPAGEGRRARRTRSRRGGTRIRSASTPDREDGRAGAPSPEGGNTAGGAGTPPRPATDRGTQDAARRGGAGQSGQGDAPAGERARRARPRRRGRRKHNDQTESEQRT